MSDAAPIMIVAGEASGDLHGATLCRALRALAPERRLVGMGGDRMAAAGLERLADVPLAGELRRGVPAIHVVRGDAYAVMRAGDLLLVTSGTAALEGSLLGT